MPTIPSAFYRDANRVPIWTDGLIAKKTITFDGGTAGGWGEDAGVKDGAAIFTVDGAVRAQVFGICTTDLAGGATEAVGITGATTIFLPTETDTDINAGDFWINNATPAAYFILGAETAAAKNLPLYVLNGNDIIITTAGGASTTSGVIDFYCIWVPWSTDGNVTAS